MPDSQSRIDFLLRTALLSPQRTIYDLSPNPRPGDRLALAESNALAISSAKNWKETVEGQPVESRVMNSIYALITINNDRKLVDGQHNPHLETAALRMFYNTIRAPYSQPGMPKHEAAAVSFQALADYEVIASVPARTTAENLAVRMGKEFLADIAAHSLDKGIATALSASRRLIETVSQVQDRTDRDEFRPLQSFAFQANNCRAFNDMLTSEARRMVVMLNAQKLAGILPASVTRAPGLRNPPSAGG